MLFVLAVLVIAFLAGGTAAITGFGIGSLLTPLLAVQLGAQLAVAAVAVPHAAGTALRCARLRRAVDKSVLWRFGIPSAAG
ncbi:MAG TPA: TSUP family transporter, partial [Gemmatimonadales bacterium]|nr:TSUP family transporter [Gemmatimonadales bacterium]